MTGAVLALVVSLTGGGGAVLRYVLDGIVQERTSETLPFGTIFVNIVGSFVLGVLTGVTEHHVGPNSIRPIIGVGFCGGFTTWSAASYETMRLVEDHRYRRAAISAVGGVGLSLLAAGIGLGVGLL